MRIFRQRTVEAFPLESSSAGDSTDFNSLLAADKLSLLKSQLDVELSLLSSTAELLDSDKLRVTAPTIHPIAMELRNKITQLKTATVLLNTLVESLRGHPLILSLEALQRLYSSLDPTIQRVIADAEPILKLLSSRILKTPGLDDFNFDEAIEILSRSEEEVHFVDLKKDILAELNNWPSLAHINDFIKRWQCIVREKAVKEESHSEHTSANILHLLIQLKKHLSRHSYSYSYAEIVSSKAFERCFLAKDAESLVDAAGEELADSRGCYTMKPTTHEVERGLEEYNRTNRPLLRLYDETSAIARLCLIRTPGAETDAPDITTFAGKILNFCDGNELFRDFICANLGIEPFMISACENMNTLRIDPKYMPLFPTDQYSTSWHKLINTEGNVYYQHRLTTHCFHVTTTKGQIAVLKGNWALAGNRELTECSAAEYEAMLTVKGSLIPLFSTSTLSQINLAPPSAEASSPSINLAVIEHTVTILTSEIKDGRCPSPGYGAASSSSDEEMAKLKL